MIVSFSEFIYSAIDGLFSARCGAGEPERDQSSSSSSSSSFAGNSRHTTSGLSVHETPAAAQTIHDSSSSSSLSLAFRTAIKKRRTNDGAAVVACSDDSGSGSGSGCDTCDCVHYQRVHSGRKKRPLTPCNDGDDDDDDGICSGAMWRSGGACLHGDTALAQPRTLPHAAPQPPPERTHPHMITPTKRKQDHPYQSPKQCRRYSQKQPQPQRCIDGATHGGVSCGGESIADEQDVCNDDDDKYI